MIFRVLTRLFGLWEKYQVNEVGSNQREKLIDSLREFYRICQANGIALPFSRLDEMFTYRDIWQGVSINKLAKGQSVEIQSEYVLGEGMDSPARVKRVPLVCVYATSDLTEFNLSLGARGEYTSRVEPGKEYLIGRRPLRKPVRDENSTCWERVYGIRKQGDNVREYNPRLICSEKLSRAHLFIQAVGDGVSITNIGKSRLEVIITKSVAGKAREKVLAKLTI